MALRRLAVAACWLLAASAHAQPVQEIPSADSSLTHVAWRPSGRVERWIVSLHGTGGSARRDVEVWQKSLGGRLIGILAIQWWRGQGDAYLPPFDIYHEIDFAASKLEIKPGTALLHGFSRGSDNLYAVAAIDNGTGRKLFSLYVASSGRMSPDYPPTAPSSKAATAPVPLPAPAGSPPAVSATAIPTATVAPACAAPDNGCKSRAQRSWTQLRIHNSVTAHCSSIRAMPSGC